MGNVMKLTLATRLPLPHSYRTITIPLTTLSDTQMLISYALSNSVDPTSPLRVKNLKLLFF